MNAFNAICVGTFEPHRNSPNQFKNAFRIYTNCHTMCELYFFSISQNIRLQKFNCFLFDLTEPPKSFRKYEPLQSNQWFVNIAFLC